MVLLQYNNSRRWECTKTRIGVVVHLKIMPKPSKSKQQPESQSEMLKGWKAIAEFLGEPPTVVKRWAAEGMPVVEQGRFVTSSPEQLNRWLGRESGKPVHVTTPQTDLTAELKRGIAFARQSKKGGKQSPSKSVHS
jgi:hypothetical protein